MTTYPITLPASTISSEDAFRLLNSPALVARRVADMASQRFVSDYLLQGRFEAKGGGIFYPSGEELFPNDDPETIAPAAEYPLTALTPGELVPAKTLKRGHGTEVTDEAIDQRGPGIVDNGLATLVNGVIRDVDRIAMGVIESKITATYTSVAWADAESIIAGVLAAQAQGEDLEKGYSFDTVVLKGAQYAKVMSAFAASGLLPREGGNPIISGSLPAELLGLTWVKAPHMTGTNPLLIDRDALGGMADSKLPSPEFRRYGQSMVEGASQRTYARDGWLVRARRVTVPVVTNPDAGIEILSTGL